jgi:hypothetical protein
MACGGPPPASQFPSARLAIDRIREQARCSRGLDYLGDAGRLRARSLYVLQRPAGLRFDLISPFGTVISTLSAEGEQFSLLDTEHKQLVVGRANACSISQVLKVPLPPAVLGEVLTGLPPVLQHDPAQAVIAWKSGAYQVSLNNGGFSEIIRFLPRPDDFVRPWQEQRLRVIEASIEEGGELYYSVELSEHAAAHTAPPRVDPDGVLDPIAPSGPACDAEVPRRVRFRAAEQDLLLEQLEVAHNPPLVPGVFTQEAPPGVHVVPSNCTP